MTIKKGTIIILFILNLLILLYFMWGKEPVKELTYNEFLQTKKEQNTSIYKEDI